MKAPRAFMSDRRVPGVSATAFTIRFVLWMQQLHDLPDWRRIVMHFDVSRATAYRWLQAWRDANGLPPPVRPKKPKKPNISQVKAVWGYLPKSANQSLACWRCARNRDTGQQYWVWCGLHNFSVRRGGTCPNFEKRKQP